MYTFRVLFAIYNQSHCIYQNEELMNCNDETDEQNTSVIFGEYGSTFCSEISAVKAMFYYITRI